MVREIMDEVREAFACGEIVYSVDITEGSNADVPREVWVGIAAKFGGVVLGKRMVIRNPKGDARLDSPALA